MADNFLKQMGYGNNQQNSNSDSANFLKQMGYGNKAQRTSSAPPSVAPTQTTTTTEIPKVEEPKKKKSGWDTFWETLGNVILGTNSTSASNISAGYNQAVKNDVAKTVKENVDFQNYLKTTRQSELADFDRQDTSPVVYRGKDYSITQAKLDKWLDPNYKLSEPEAKQAKEYAKYLDSEVKKDSFEHAFDYGGLDFDTKRKMTQNSELLKTKTSGARQYAYGLVNELPGVKQLQKMTAHNFDKVMGNTNESDYQKNYYDSAQGAYYTAGKATSKIAQYYTLNQSGLLEPLASKIGGWFSSRLGTGLADAAYKLGLSEKAINGALTLGETLGTSIGNITADEIADIVLDTLPEIAENVDKGMSAEEVTKEALKNLGLNAAFNVGGEVLSNIPNIKQAVTAKKQSKALTQNLDDVAKQTDEVIDGVKAAEMPEIETIAKQTENLTPEVEPVLKGQNNVQMTIDDLIDSTKAEAPEIKPVEPVQPREIKNLETNGPMRESGMSQHIRSQEDVTVYTPMKMEDVSDEVVADFIKDPQMYNVLKNKDTKALAEEIYNSGDQAIKIGDKVYSGNAETKFRTLLSEKNPAALPLGQQIAKDYSASGNHTMAAQIYRDMGQALTESGQFSQAAVINMMKNDPLTAMSYAKKQLDALNREGAKKFGKKWKTLALSEDELKAFGDIAPGDEEAIKALFDQIGARLGKEAPTSFSEKLLEGRKLAMLFNVRTNVRNFGANVPTLGLRWMADRVEALGQNIAHLINPNFKVTQAITGSGIEGRKLAKEVFNSDRVKTLLDGDVGKYEIPELKSALMRNRQMYKGTRFEKWLNKATNGGIENINKKLFGKENVESILETIRNTTYKALDLGDKPFVRENFIERLGSYINAQGIKNIDDVPDEAIQMAWEEAMKATYKDDSWAVEMLRGFKKGLERVPVVGKPLSQAVVPFLQAPGNIAARMVDYSPIRGAKGIADIISGAKKLDDNLVRKGIEEVAKGLTGTGLVLFGMKLRESGILTGNYAKDKDEKNFQKQNGFKPWSLHIGDKYLTYDWAQPFAQNLMVGALVQEAIDNSDKEDQTIMDYLNVPYEGAKAAINSWFDESPLQSLSDLFKGNYNGEKDIAQNLIDVAIGDFAGAFVPASINAIAKTNDTTQRNYYDPSSKINTFFNQQKAKIPGLSETLPAKYDTWGNEVQYANSKGEAFAQRFLIPGELSTEKDDAVNTEINRLFDSTSNNKVFPLTAGNKVGDTTLNNSQVSEYQRDMGQRSRKLVEAYINSDLYKSSSDDARVEILDQLYGISRTITERDMFKKPVSDNSTYKRAISVYDKGGVSGLIDFLSKKTELDNAANIGPGDTTKIFNYVADKGGGMTQVNQWLTALGNDPIDQEKYDSLLDSREEEQRKAEFEKRYPEYNIKYVAASNGIDYLRNKGVTDIPQLGEMLYTAKKTPSKEETAVYDMGGYNALGLYYTMKADASGMNPGGSANSLDEKEMAVYLWKNGYGYDDFNKWRAARGNDTPVDRSKYNKYINEGRKWTIPELKSQTAGSLSDFLKSYGK